MIDTFNGHCYKNPYRIVHTLERLGLFEDKLLD